MCSLTIFSVKLVIKNWFTPKKTKTIWTPEVQRLKDCVQEQNNYTEEKRHENCIRMDKIYLQFEFFIVKYII